MWLQQFSHFQSSQHNYDYFNNSNPFAIYKITKSTMNETHRPIQMWINLFMQYNINHSTHTYTYCVRDWTVKDDDDDDRNNEFR